MNSKTQKHIVKRLNALLTKMHLPYAKAYADGDDVYMDAVYITSKKVPTPRMGRKNHTIDGFEIGVVVEGDESAIYEATMADTAVKNAIIILIEDFIDREAESHLGPDDYPVATRSRQERDTGR